MSTERSLCLQNAGRRSSREMALQWSMAIPTSLIGLLGLIHDSGIRRALESWINVHALFGVLLVSLVVTQFYWRMKYSAPMLPTEIGEFSRRLSRLVYLMLYVVIGLRQVIGVVTAIWHGGGFDFNLFEAELRRGPDREGFDPRDDLQAFVAYGLGALVTVRILAYGIWLSSSARALRRPAAERMQGVSVAAPPDINGGNGRANPRAQ